MAKHNVKDLVSKAVGCTVIENGKHIAVSVFDPKKKYGYSNKYIPNTPENRGIVCRKFGKPDLDSEGYRGRKRFIWF